MFLVPGIHYLSGNFHSFIKVMKGVKVITSTTRCRFKTSRPLNIIYLRTNSTRKKAFIPRNYSMRCFRICFKKIVEFWFHEKMTHLILLLGSHFLDCTKKIFCWLQKYFISTGIKLWLVNLHSYPSLNLGFTLI